MTLAVVGIIILILSSWGMIVYWWSFLEILRGLFPFLGVLVGLIFIGAGSRKAIKKSSE